MSKPKSTDPWLTPAEAGKIMERKLSGRQVKRLAEQGEFGAVGDGSGDEPVKRIPFKPNFGGEGFSVFIRKSAVKAYEDGIQRERESLRGNRPNATA